jgi:Domain of unknown function (DUF4271)
MGTTGFEAAPRVHDVLSEGWVGLVLLSAIIVLAWTNVRARKKWALLRDGVFRLRLGQQTMRDDISLRDRGLIALIAAALALVGLFIHQTMVHTGGLTSGLSAFFPILSAVVGVTVAQALIIRLTSWFFKMDPGLGEYLYTSLLLTAAFGLALLPLTLLVAYQPATRNIAIFAGVVMLLAMLLYRWFRAVVIGLGQGVGPGNIFLYICASEILPAALAVQAIAQQAQLPSDPV